MKLRNSGEIFDAGEGKPLMLLHGHLLDHTMFTPQYALSDQFRVLAFDSRARTNGPLATAPYSLYDLADDCCKVLDDRGIGGCVAGGMSMGAFTALRFALRYPKRVHGVVLIGARASAFSEDEKHKWSAYYGTRRGQEVGIDFATGEGPFNFYEGVEARQPGLIAEWNYRVARRNGDSMHFESDSWLSMDDVRNQLFRIEVPVLIIHGDKDASVSVNHALDIYDRLPEAELLILPRTGHAANLERPNEVNRAIQEFMGRLS